MSQVPLSDFIAQTSRVLPFTPSQIFVAFEQPQLLAQWWGPDGFRNTFEQFDFMPGGRWVFVMHGPNGANYPNENVFLEIVPDRKVVIGHVSQPHFTLTVTLTADGTNTHLTWVQQFESAEVAAQVRHIVEPSNEQNLDRLTAVLNAMQS